MQETQISTAKEVEDGLKVIRSLRKNKDIFGDGSTLAMLKKAVRLGSNEETREASQTNAGASVGVKTHLIDKDVAQEIKEFNSTHAICLDAKVSSTVGLGHREESIHEKLDPLCKFSWQDTLTSGAEDYWEGADCYIECVLGNKNEPRQITGLHMIEAVRVNVEVEEEGSSELFHYIVSGETGNGEQLIMAKWGGLKDLKARFQVVDDEGGVALPRAATRNANEEPQQSARANTLSGDIRNSELIHIRQPTNRSPWYGYPDYMSAVPSIELVQCMTQHEFDFYYNRGVPEFLLFLIGNNLGKCWEKIEELIKSNQGPGNSHKTGGINIPGNPEDVKVQLEKLAMEDAGNSGFSEKSGTLDMRIATAHGMPPALANIALPGKMSASNETPNAMLIFQMRKLGQAQKNFSRVFARTLGAPETSFAQPDGKPVKISADDFLAKNAKPMTDDGVPQFIQKSNGFNTILDGMTLGEANTMANMREPLAGSGRNPANGTLSGARDRKPGESRATRAPGSGK